MPAAPQSQPSTPAQPTTTADLLDLIREGHLLLLPNPRAARTLRAAYDAAQRVAGLAAWQPARAITWQQWTTSLWSDLVLAGADTRLLLNPAQEQSLWREIITSANPTLTSPDSLAALAASAHTLAAQHLALPRLRSTACTHDTTTFAEWADTFARLCTTRQLLPAALLEPTLIPHLNHLTLPTTLHLIDSTDPTPAQQSLLSALAPTVQIHHHTLIHPRPQTHLIATAPNITAELSLAALWLRSHLEAHPTHTIAVLLPNPSDDRAALDQALRQHLAPELNLINVRTTSNDAKGSSSDTISHQNNPQSAPWEFSTGVPLTTLPLIADLLALAHWTTTTLPLDRISALLLSPYLGQTEFDPATDRSSAARFDATILRRQTLLRPELTLRELLTLADSSNAPELLPTWLRDLHQFLLEAPETSRPLTHADWADHLRDLAAAVHWPGPRPLTPTEFESTRAWDSALDLLSTLDFTGRRLNLHITLQTLDRQLQQTLFTPPTTHAPIQILAPEDSPGSIFDAVLFLRCTDANWPRSSRPNPLLSWPLQHALNMPGTDPARSAAAARNLTANLLTRCGIALFTHAKQNADGHLRPSPLLAALNLTPITLPPAEPAISLIPEHIPDDAPIPALPQDQVFGGTQLLQAQAACPFRAFAQFRLHSTDLDSQDLGLDAADRGNHVHKVLELFWQRVKTQQNLRNLAPADLERHLVAAIDTTLYRRLTPNSPWDLAYLDSQRQRLLTLLTQWLPHELQRGPFEVLDAEHAQLVPIGPLTLKVRIDRIDRILPENNELDDSEAIFLVDYKTGLANPNQWLGDRPDEPQLPLYSLIPAPESLRGLAFATLRPGVEMKWNGYQSEPGILPPVYRDKNLRPDLPSLVADWKSTLTNLAYDFAEGIATVAPKDYPGTCKHCAQRLLCRLDPTTLNDSPADDLDA